MAIKRPKPRIRRDAATPAPHVTLLRDGADVSHLIDADGSGAFSV
jgi:hypothetical protein